MSRLEATATIKASSDRTPNRSFWLLFRVSSLDRLVQMQKGFLYMNSLEYFSQLEGESATALRRDELEKVYASFKAGNDGELTTKLLLKISEGGVENKLDLGQSAVLTVDFPRPQNMMIFCMGALADDINGNIPGEIDSKFKFDERFHQFGDHILIITNPSEFSHRINVALKKEKNAFGSPFFEGGYGLIDYINSRDHTGCIGLFRKDIKYSWQREFRISFGVKDPSLNDRAAYVFNIGSIEGISQVIKLQSLIDTPLSIKRTILKKVDGKYIEIDG